VHISHLADTFVDDPNKIVKVSQQVTVTVLEVDLKRNRISLSMKGNDNKPASRLAQQRRDEFSYDANDMQSALAALKNKFGK
jgi:uncharacterized protein